MGSASKAKFDICGVIALLHCCLALFLEFASHGFLVYMNLASMTKCLVVICGQVPNFILILGKNDENSLD